MTGSESQIEWAERIKTSIRGEFDRVARALRMAADRQQGQDHLDTLAIIAILEDKRAEVLSNEQAGYFVRVWQELSDQVRQMLAQDSRCQAIQIERRARKAGKPHGV
jgi:hypothetical protein